MPSDVLPDSRTRARRGGVRSAIGTLVPVYCANCGRENGRVPESMITHVFALCDGACVEKYGHIAHFLRDPDAIFRERAAEAQRESGITTPVQLAKALQDPSSKVSKVAREWRAYALRSER